MKVELITPIAMGLRLAIRGGKTVGAGVVARSLSSSECWIRGAALDVEPLHSDLLVDDVGGCSRAHLAQAITKFSIEVVGKPSEIGGNRWPITRSESLSI